MMNQAHQMLLDQCRDNTAVAGVVGLGYVGLPLAVEIARSGYRVVGFDVSEQVVARINRRESHILDVPSEVVRAYVGGVRRLGRSIAWGSAGRTEWAARRIVR